MYIPTTRTKEMQTLLRGEGQYDPASLKHFKTYLDDQIAKDHYDIEANLALLKLFAIHREIKDYEVMRKVLLKSLMAFPAIDFNQCNFLISEGKDQEEVRDVVKLATLLETGKFKQFWTAAEAVPLLKSIKGWEDKVRGVVAAVVSSTYRGIQLTTLAELFNMKDGSKELDAIVKTCGWTKEGARVVVNPTLLSAPEAAEQDSQQVNSAMTLDDYKRLMTTTAF